MEPTEQQLHPDSVVIDCLGGTKAVADLCEIKPPSVSEWRKTGIPSARKQYLRLLCPEAFKRAQSGDSTTQH